MNNHMVSHMENETEKLLIIFNLGGKIFGRQIFVGALGWWSEVKRDLLSGTPWGIRDGVLHMDIDARQSLIIGNAQ